MLLDLVARRIEEIGTSKTSTGCSSLAANLFPATPPGTTGDQVRVQVGMKEFTVQRPLGLASARITLNTQSPEAERGGPHPRSGVRLDGRRVPDSVD